MTVEEEIEVIKNPDQILSYKVDGQIWFWKGDASVAIDSKKITPEILELIRV